MKNVSTLFLLGLIATVGIFTLDVYLPGMPAMAKEFNVSMTQIGFTFTGFSIVFAISQIFHGMFSDYIGRKPILVGGLIVAAIATIFCITAKTYESLLIARAFQAIGISVFVVVNAIIRDLYTGTMAIQVRTFVTSVSGICLSIAPTVGGLLQNKLDWQGGFIASLILILITLAYALLFFKESNHTKNQSKLKVSSFITSYVTLFSDFRYVTHVIIATLAYTVHFTFIILSAKIFIDLLGFTPLTFGYLMFVYGGIHFVSGLLTAYIAKRFSTPLLIKLGSMCIGMGGVLMFFLALKTFTAWKMLLPMSVVIAGITTVRATAATGALAPIPNQAGQGAAGLNLMTFMLSAIIASGVSELGTEPQLSIALLAIASATAILFLITWLHRAALPKPAQEVCLVHHNQEKRK